MRFDPELAEIRFGYGLSPSVAPPGSAVQMLERLQAADEIARQFPVPGFAEAFADTRTYARLSREKRKAKTDLEAAERAYKDFRRGLGQRRMGWLGQLLLRRALTGDAFRERLAVFWADHFTAQGKAAAYRHLAGPYAETAIRPHIAGRFEDLLIAVATSPLMLHYLDQAQSAGPNSARAQKAKRLKGLNENLAREVLELHTLGVGGPYSQDDVRQLAELFTGLSFDREDGFRFRPGLAEPGAETVLGKSYGGSGPGRLEPVLAALRDLAAHPATAKHIARKLAVHFVSDTPDPALIAHVAGRYRDTGGRLADVYAALLEHPAAWEPSLRNVKPPLAFISSACRALGVSEARVAELGPRGIRRLIYRPLRKMGQTWEAPPGPDGWAEQDSAWITPHGLAARLRWAMLAPQRLAGPLPDPRQFAAASLGQYADARVMFAAGAAETRAEAVGLVLASPAFQRR